MIQPLGKVSRGKIDTLNVVDKGDRLADVYRRFGKDTCLFVDHSQRIFKKTVEALVILAAGCKAFCPLGSHRQDVPHARQHRL